MSYNFNSYNYLLSGDLGQLVKGTELEGVNILNAILRVQKMDEDTLRALCMKDDLRLVEQGEYDKTLTSVWDDEENEEIPKLQLVELLWSKKDKKELIDILFGADIEDGGFGSIEELMKEINLIKKNPKKYLLDQAYDDLLDSDDELLFETPSHDSNNKKLNDKIAETLTKEMTSAIEAVYKERLSHYLKMGEPSSSLLKDSIQKVQYKIDKGSLKNIDLDLKDQGPHKATDKNNFYWEVKEGTETYEEKDLDHDLFVVNFTGRIITEGLTIPISHGVWIAITRDKDGNVGSFQLFQTYI